MQAKTTMHATNSARLAQLDQCLTIAKHALDRQQRHERRQRRAGKVESADRLAALGMAALGDAENAHLTADYWLLAALRASDMEQTATAFEKLRCDFGGWWYC